MSVATEMMKLAKAEMAEQFAASRWFLTAPKEARMGVPKIDIIGIENRKVELSEGIISHGFVMMPFLVGMATVAGIQAKLSLRLDFGRGGLVVEEQSESVAK
jgi:hypothetical protein